MQQRRNENNGLGPLLVASGVESHVRADMRFARRFGLEAAQPLGSGVVALQRLLRRPAGLVIADDTLDDMRGLDFLRLARLHPDLRATPIILASATGTRDAVLAAKEAGCSGYLIRPYSPASFGRQVSTALQGGWPALPDAPDKEAFERALAAHLAPAQAPETAQTLCDEGERLLSAGSHSAAIAVFRRALDLDAASGAACFGLGRAWNGLGHRARARRWLERASQLFAAHGRVADAHDATQTLRRTDTNAPDPRAGLAMRLLRRGDAQATAKLYGEALGQGAGDSGVFLQLARACLFTGNPTATARALARELAKVVAEKDESELYARIMGPEHDEPPAAGAANLSELPSLREIVAVARHTLKAYRGAL